MINLQEFLNITSNSSNELFSNSEFFSIAITLVIASGVDFCLGDPWSWPHPVQFMGSYIQRYQQFLLPRIQSPLGQRCLGIGLMTSLVSLTLLGSWRVIAWAQQLHPLLGQGVSITMLASCFAGCSLRKAADEVLEPLEQDNLEEARDRLSRYVGRDTAELTKPDIYRALFETVTENAVDGVLAPLFYGIIGALTPLGPAPLALAYKALSTLDSMVGYREMPYQYLGWCSARCEDIATWLPCRLSVLSIALWSGQPGHVLRLCWRDADQDPSPNAGWSECAYAAALGVQVGGSNVYRGVVKHKPLLGDDEQPVTAERIQQALTLTRKCFLTGLAGAILLLYLLSLRI